MDTSAAHKHRVHSYPALKDTYYCLTKDNMRSVRTLSKVSYDMATDNGDGWEIYSEGTYEECKNDYESLIA